jgi:hypothetical protein
MNMNYKAFGLYLEFLQVHKVKLTNDEVVQILKDQDYSICVKSYCTWKKGGRIQSDHIIPALVRVVGGSVEDIPALASLPLDKYKQATTIAIYRMSISASVAQRRISKMR